MRHIGRLLSTIIILLACLGLLAPTSVMAVAPSVTSVSINPTIAYTDTDLEAVVEGWTDADGDTENYNWVWQKYNVDTDAWDTISDIDSDTNTDTLANTYFNKDDEIKVICTPFSGDEYGTAMEASISISNSVPSIDSVNVDPDPATTESTLEATAVGWADADNDEPQYLWQWQKWDGTDWVDITDATSNILENSKFVLGDMVQITCTPFDGSDYGTAVVASVEISVLDYSSNIDVKVGSEENPINLKSKGVIPVVIYTTEDFDATTIDISTIQFGPAWVAPSHYAYEDIDEDGDIDLILHFRTQDSGICEDDTSVSISGLTDSGTKFSATNPIKIVPAKDTGSEEIDESNSENNGNSGDKSNGKDSAPGQQKEPGESAEGKGNDKNK